jgi:hypothetical protein
MAAAIDPAGLGADRKAGRQQPGRLGRQLPLDGRAARRIAPQRRKCRRQLVIHGGIVEGQRADEEAVSGNPMRLGASDRQSQQCDSESDGKNPAHGHAEWHAQAWKQTRDSHGILAATTVTTSCPIIGEPTSSPSRHPARRART